MKSQFLIRFACVSTVAAVSLLVPCVIAKASRPANATWLLKQKHRTYGSVEVYLSDKGVKVISSNADYVFLCAAPSWDAVIYSDKRKVYSKRPLSQWTKHGFRTALDVQNNSTYYTWPKVAEKSQNYAGIDATVFAFPLLHKNQRPADLKFGKVGEYVVGTSCTESKFPEEFLQSLYDVPPARGIPLRFVKIGRPDAFGFGLSYNQRSQVQTILDTFSARPFSGAVDFSKSLTNYKAVDESKVVIRHEDMNDVFKQLMER
ncbi:MAG TPA: hypothetical protein V6D17_13400 [Candidatus Obscuribacterales bacterium]